MKQDQIVKSGSRRKRLILSSLRERTSRKLIYDDQMDLSTIFFENNFPVTLSPYE